MTFSHRSWQDQETRHWLEREAPRYTSYPSAHHFEAVLPQTYAGWLAKLRPDQSVGLYVHVPFCERMCWFCGCNTQITRRYEPVETYVDHLIQEIGLVAKILGFRPSAHALHFGGGSPGILTPATITRLFDAIHAAFDLTPGAEVSIEVDPRRLTVEKAEAYGRQGFNRISFGVQDTQAEVQAAINRIQPMEMMLEAAAMIRAQGIDAIGIDLVYGLPHQSEHSLERTVADVAQLDPGRISAYSYAHVPWARKHQRLIDASALPQTADKAQQYLHLDHLLRGAGYVAVGIDHFARPDDGLATAVAAGTLRRNFMGYTDLPNDRLIGLGASSISQLDDGMAQNAPQATTYASRMSDGALPTVRGWAFRDDDRARAEVISSLMCAFRADLATIAVRHGLSPEHFDDDLAGLTDFIDAGMVQVVDRVVTFDAPLKMLVRPVACAFDRYARQAEGGNRYSRVA